ncbi:GIY-YIG nuclease family protein [Microbulbifer sp. SAOS-129_SWC]|uniref:GIY-YIG nuclease family protein n=1 Tax=Microbulbifer sp. SAOS-129_SWC TaxID=3145235 RepID=UPI0032165A06
MNEWFVYLIRTNRGTLYTGITRDVERRFEEHSSGGPKAAKALRGRGPLTLEFHCAVADKSAALKLEMEIKKWPKKKKEALITGAGGLIPAAYLTGPKGVVDKSQ